MSIYTNAPSPKSSTLSGIRSKKLLPSNTPDEKAIKNGISLVMSDLLIANTNAPKSDIALTISTENIVYDNCMDVLYTFYSS